MSKRKDVHTTEPQTSEAYLPGDGKQEGPQPTNHLPETDGSFQNFQRIIEATHDSVISLDMQGRVTYWSPSSEAIYGYKSEEVIGKALKSFLVPAENQKEFSELIKKISGRGERVTDFVARRKTKDRRILDVLLNIFALTDDDGNIIGSCIIAKDITQQLAQEGQVRKQHNILQQAEELAKTGSWEYNTSTREFLWSDGMFELFDIRKGTKVSPPIYVENSIDADKAVAFKIVQSIQSKFEPFEEIIHIKGRTGIKTVAVKAAPLKNENGDVEKMLGVDMDITTARQSEQTITQLNRELRLVNSELKNFATIAANNYGETLRHLYIFLELVVTQDARSLSNSGRANLRRAQSAIQRLKLLTDDINRYLQLYDIGVNKAVIDTGSIIQGTLSSMNRKIDESNATIDLGSLVPLHADPLLFSMLISNLVDNAIKFRKLVLPPVIRIRSSRADEINSVNLASRDTPYTIVSVSDNGIGFRDEEAERIFELFFQLNNKGSYKGSGIGLAICTKIMEMHGGFITAEGQPAQGATFYCYFPGSVKSVRSDHS